jgi:hypothetical protein
VAFFISNECMKEKCPYYMLHRYFSAAL